MTTDPLARVAELTETLTKFCIVEEFDYPADVPEFCGYTCIGCQGSGATQPTVKHSDDCAIGRALTGTGDDVLAVGRVDIVKGSVRHYAFEQSGAPDGEYKLIAVPMRAYIAKLDTAAAPTHLSNEQAAYDFGYDNPSLPARTQKWLHLVDVNAFTCGQADAQNWAPRNKDYQREQYDRETFERLPAAPTDGRLANPDTPKEGR